MGVRAYLAVVIFLASAAVSPADEQADLKALVDKAVKAVGGEANLKKVQGITLKGKGTIHVDNQEVQFSLDGAAQGLDRFRLDLEATVGGNTIKALAVFQVDKVWVRGPNNQVEQAPDEVGTWMKTESYALRLAQTLLPLRDPACKLTPMGEVMVNGRPAVGLKAAAKDRPEVNIYFDKETGLLARADFQVKDTLGPGEVAHEFLFSEAKEMNGLKHFTKVLLNRDGKKLMEFELSEVSGNDKLDMSLFDRP